VRARFGGGEEGMSGNVARLVRPPRVGLDAGLSEAARVVRFGGMEVDVESFGRWLNGHDHVEYLNFSF
jgi:hypothetical protein